MEQDGNSVREGELEEGVNIGLLAQVNTANTTLRVKPKGRLAARAPNSMNEDKDFSQAQEKPPGTFKGTNKCLTCIQYNRVCTGTQLVSVQLKTGKKEIRCETCAAKVGHGGRLCYWKESVKGITNYIDAKIYYGGIKNEKNTRAGRITRAQDDPRTRLTLQSDASFQHETEDITDDMDAEASSESSEGKFDDQDENDIAGGGLDHAFGVAKATVVSLLETQLGRIPSIQEIRSGLVVYVSSLEADQKLVEGLKAKVNSFRSVSS